MIFTPIHLQDAYLIELEAIADERGFFARIFCTREFTKYGLNPNVIQSNLSYNKKQSTLRGMHYQLPPNAEVKLVRCIRGAVYDVIIDLRPNSPTYGHWMSFELTAENRLMLYVPEGFAHGYQTLLDDTEVLYQVSCAYAPGSERGIRWDDPTFSIEWPFQNPILSAKDAGHLNFQLDIFPGAVERNR